MLKLFQQYVIPNYGRYPVALAHGEGSYIWDAEGNRYLDFFPGWGCGLLGHCPGPVVEAVREQLGLPDPRAQHLAHRGPGAVGKGIVRSKFRRPGLFLQLGNRGQRGGHQARAAAQHAQAPLQDHHLRRQLPRPHARIADRDGPAQVSRRPGAADGRFRLCAVRRPRRRGPADRQRNGRHHDRADPGRRRGADSARGFPGRLAQTGRRTRYCCWSSTRCRAASAARATGSPTRRPA